MIRVAVVVILAIAVVLFVHNVAEQNAGQNAAGDSQARLVALSEGRPYTAPDHGAWYADPITVSLVAGGVVLLVGLGAVLAMGQERSDLTR